MSVILARFESSVVVQKAAYLENHLLCRIVLHFCRIQLLTAQFSPIVNTEPKKHRTEVPKWELPDTIGDSPFEACKEKWFINCDRERQQARGR